jgi:hypothetical protein
VLAITPSDGERYSRAPALEQRGFQKVNIPEFRPFGNDWPALCSVYQKRMLPGERLDLRALHLPLTPERASWCILLAETPRPAGRIGDQDARHPSTFSPPLAMNYTVAAEVPDPQAYFIHDPGMCVLPSGALLVAAPVWGRSGRGRGGKHIHGPQYLHLARSRDGGRTWQRLPDQPWAEGTPFVVRDTLYLFTQPRQHGDVYFTRSHDEGETWEDPVKVLEGAFWNCQTSMVVRGDTLYWVLDERHQALTAIAGDLKQDLLSPGAWRRSEVVRAPGVPASFRFRQTETTSTAPPSDWTLEANVMDINGRLRVACRVNATGGGTPGVAALWEICDDAHRLDLQFRQYVPWPGAYCKFCIVEDEKSGLYWMAASQPTGLDPSGLGAGGDPGDRSMLMLYYALDGHCWIPAGCIAMAPDSSQSFMYPSMHIDGDDLVILSRSGRRSGNYHDADQATFHRVRGFRSLAWN